MPGTETKHKVRDVNVRMLRGGSGPPLLFLHGANGLPVWLPVFDLLSKQFEVFVPEHPGFGTSDNPAWLRNIGDLAMYYLDFLDEFGPHEVHVVGQSLGGWAAAEAAVRNCSRIKTPVAARARRHPHQGHAERRQLHLGPGGRRSAISTTTRPSPIRSWRCSRPTSRPTSC